MSETPWVPKVIAFAGRAGSGKNTAAVKVGLMIPGSREYAFAAPLKEFCEAIFGMSRARLYGPSELRNEPVTWTQEDRHAIRTRFWNLGKEFSGEWTSAILDAGIEFGFRQRTTAIGALIEWFESVMARSKAGESLSARTLLQELGTDVCRVHYSPDLWAAVVISRIARDSKAERFPVAIITDCRFENEALLTRKTLRAKVVLITRGTVAPLIYGAHPSETSLPDETQCDHVIVNDRSLDDLTADIHDMLEGFGWIE